MSRYNFYVDEKNKTVICVSSYEGKRVKGRAKCHPNDEFDLAIGERLARLRCDKKVAQKRVERAIRKLYEAGDARRTAYAREIKMAAYVNEAQVELDRCCELLKDVENTFTKN